METVAVIEPVTEQEPAQTEAESVMDAIVQEEQPEAEQSVVEEGMGE